MLLAIDIGNTNITCGIFADGRLKKRFNIATSEYSFATLKKAMMKASIDDAIICSVVPFATNKVAKDLKGFLGKNAYIIGEDIKVPIKNLYRKPKEVGQDRLVNAYAGVLLYGSPLIVIDFGTAITFDVISKNKEYLGGMILPGLGISLEALYERTALLPKIKLESPRELIGRSTKNSMLSGIVYGFACLADDLSERIKAQIGKGVKVIATGGNISLITKYCRKIDKIDPDLTLKGLNLLYRNT
ncbi:MAG: type III pantothenate kinase [Candidatus Omnitrophota bacterium]|nr:type III pantothenate kinase [Candidatus Omnitrophota bacterium]